MEEETGTAGSIAPLRNVVNFDSLVRRLQSTKPNLPRIGVMFGNSGLGKTYAAAFAANEHQAKHVQVGFSWTQRYFCKAVMIELGLIRPNGNVKGSIPDMVAMIAKQLATSGKILMVDDAQNMERKGMLDIITEIYEASQSPIILIGEEKLPEILVKRERLHNRVLAWEEAQPSDVNDCNALARLVCDGIEVKADLLEKVCKAVSGCARRIVTNLDNIRQYAADRDLTSIDSASYNGTIQTGDHRSK